MTALIAVVLLVTMVAGADAMSSPVVFGLVTVGRPSDGYVASGEVETSRTGVTPLRHFRGIPVDESRPPAADRDRRSLYKSGVAIFIESNAIGGAASGLEKVAIPPSPSSPQSLALLASAAESEATPTPGPTNVPGQAVAGEAGSNLADPWFRNVSLLPAAILVVLAGLVISVRGSPRRTAVPLAVAAFASGAVELVEWSAHRFGGVAFQTLPFHAAVSAVLLLVFLYMLLRQRLRLDGDERERDAMQQLLAQVVSDNSDGIVVFDDRHVTLAASRAAGTILGESGQLTGRDVRTFLPAPVLRLLDEGAIKGPTECTWDIAWQTRTLELVVSFSEIRTAPGSRKQARRVTCLMFKDTTDRLRQQQRLSYLVKHEPVTGALSRSALAEAIDALLAAGKPVRVVIVRLNRLRLVTTSLGHQVSEAVLRQVYKRLRGIGNVEAARLGSDVFGIAVVDNTTIEELIHHFSNTLDKPYALDGRTTILESVFGASATPSDSSNSAELLRQAEIALSAHDDGSRRNFTVFTPELATRIEARQTLDGMLRQALESGEFFLLFQPQVDLRSMQMVGVEALVRWNSAKLGIVSPADFIPLAEETGLIVTLGDWVMKEACLQAAEWKWTGRLSVNVSPVQFRLGNVVKTVEDAVTGSGFDVRRLDIEITESLFAANDESTVETLEELRRLGVGVSIDDFGTGYSSLSYLARLPVDKIKIDQSFVRALPGEQSKAIIETIVSMAARLDKTVVAEGIETAEQLDYLSAIRCQVGQGYLFGRPMKGDDLWHIPGISYPGGAGSPPEA